MKVGDIYCPLINYERLSVAERIYHYMIVSKMVEDQAFSDITEIYCSDVELVTHSYGYESTEIMLADFSRAELNDAWGQTLIQTMMG